VTRRQVWRGFVDWFWPIDDKVSASGSRHDHVLSSATALGGPSALSERGTTMPLLTGEMSGGSFAGEVTSEVDEAELLEFLAADHEPVSADPVFREELRDQLWALVQEGVGMRPKDH